MRYALFITALGLLAGCASDGSYESVYVESGYGVPIEGGYVEPGYVESGWYYQTPRRDIYWQESGHYGRYDSVPYHNSYYHRSGYRYPYNGSSHRGRPDADYRDDDRDRVRTRDNNSEFREAVREQEDRIRERRERPVERIDIDDRSRQRDVVGDIRRDREREQVRREPSRAEPPRTEPRGDLNVRDVEEIRRNAPRDSGTGQEQSGDRLRRR